MYLRNLIFLHAFLLPAFGQQLKIGAVFDKKDSLEERIFKFAIASMNNELKRFNMSLVSLVRYASTMSAFENINAANQLISDGVISIIGPRTSTAVKAMHSLCMKYHIPQLSPSATDPDFMFRRFRYRFLLRMSPGDTLMSYALKDLISHFKWERVGILTSRTDYAMNSLIDFRVFASEAGLKILATEHFSVTQDPSQVDATKELLNLRQKGARVIILSCMDNYSPVVLTQAEKLEMIKDWVWILTDAAIAKEEGLYHYKEGLVALRLPTRGSGQVFEKVSREWRDIGETGHINARAGRTFDAVLTIAHALQKMAADNITITEPSIGNGLCPRTLGDQPWSLGTTFLKYLQKVRTEGIMSDIKFRFTGSPSHTIYDIVNYQSDEGWVKVGDWNEDNNPPLRIERKRPIVWLDGELDVPKLASLDLRYAKLKVLAALSRPFVMIRNKPSPGDDDLPYEGFCIDLLKKLHEKLQFAYDIQLRDKVGEKQPQGTWDGIIGELSREKADLGISTFTISPEKEKAVDFTQPYFSVSFKIVTKKTHRESKANIWGFLSPFERTLWIAIIVASAVVGTVVWTYDRLSPYGYYGRSVQSADVTQDDIHAKNTLNLINSFWSAVASYLEQGPEQFYPISYSGRALILTWWFAIAIFGATYTANLAAFLTINKYEQPIKSIEDLANQNRIAYGTAPGSLSEMLKSSSLPAYERLWRYISSHGTLETNDSFGFDKARRTEDYAFLWESATVDYEVQSKPCNTLKVIGRPFGSINYGFALPRNSPYTHNFSVAMLELQQEGFMERMTEKWFRSRSVCGAETEAAMKSEEEGGHQLEFSDMAGVFITLAVGVATGIAVLLIELVYASYKDTMDKHSQPPVSFSQVFCERLRRSCCGEKHFCSSATRREDDQNNDLKIMDDTDGDERLNYTT